MKIQIDTTAKTIKVEEDVNLSELFEALERLLPSEWKGYKMLSGTIIYWGNPIYVDIYKPVYPINPYPVWTTCGSITNSVYNIETS